MAGTTVVVTDLTMSTGPNGLEVEVKAIRHAAHLLHRVPLPDVNDVPADFREALVAWLHGPREVGNHTGPRPAPLPGRRLGSDDVSDEPYPGYRQEREGNWTPIGGQIDTRREYAEDRVRPECIRDGHKRLSPHAACACGEVKADG